MTIIRNHDIECGLCGKVSSQPILTSTNSMGYCDLDLRFPPMKRDTMNTWVVECPHCGYVAKKLDEKPRVGEDFVKSEAYTTCDGNQFKSNLSKIFYRNYLISKSEDNLEEEFYNILHCIWTCDDSDDILAEDMRKMAVGLIEKLLEEKFDDKLNIVKADLLRRSRQFDRVIEEYGNATQEDQRLKNIIRFQVGKSYLKDDGCYTIKDVIDEYGS